MAATVRSGRRVVVDHYVTALANGLAAPDTAVGAIELTTTRPGVVSSARS